MRAILPTLWGYRCLKRATLSSWVVSLAFAPSIVWAAHEQSISINSGTLQQALLSLSQQTGASIGMTGNLPERHVAGFSGRMSAETALKRLLRGTSLVAVRVGNNAWRIEHGKAIAEPKKAKPHQKPAQKPIAKATAKAGEPKAEMPRAEIIVTAAKRSQPLAYTPIASTVIDGGDLVQLGLSPTTSDLAKLADGLTLTNLGPGRNRAFLRGIGDSPFNGQTQATVATILDNARIGFSAPEPELKLVDVDRIELLKGPQGPLYGSGALGGVYRIVTNGPKLDELAANAAIEGQSSSHGGHGIAANAMVNLPLVTDRVAVRAVAYKGIEPGWINTDQAQGSNSNQQHYYGGRLALKWQVDEDWSADLSGATQYLHVDDSQYTNVPGRYERNAVAAEPHDNDFAHAQFTVNGALGAYHLVSTTSWTRQEVDSVLDASPAAALFNESAPLLFNDNRLYTLWNQELRLSTQSGPLRTMAGLSWLQAHSKIVGQIVPATGSSILVGSLDEMSRELALFGELGYEIAPFWTIDGGLRIYHSQVDDERVEAGGIKSSARHTGLSPSLSLSYNPNANHFYYLRFASAVRPGGLAVFSPVASANYDSDELLNLELGARWKLPETGLSAKLEGYANKWSHIQSDYLLANGLIGTRNSGDAIIYGIEASLDWKAGDHWNVEGGFEWQHAKLEKAAAGVAISSDQQLPIVAKLKAHANIAYRFNVGTWRSTLRSLISYSGAAKLSLDPTLDRTIGSRTQLDLSYALAHDPWHLSLSIENLTDNSRDSFGFGNPFSFQNGNQRTPIAPRKIVGQISYNF